MKFAVIIAGVFLLSFGGIVFFGFRMNNEMPAAQKDSITDYAELVEKLMPSMVYIESYSGFGSGFFVSSQGDILTSYHVVDNSYKIKVTTIKGQVFEAELKHFDKVRDIALIKIDIPYFETFLKVSEVLPKQGEAIIAL